MEPQIQIWDKSATTQVGVIFRAPYEEIEVNGRDKERDKHIKLVEDKLISCYGSLESLDFMPLKLPDSIPPQDRSIGIVGNLPIVRTLYIFDTVRDMVVGRCDVLIRRKV